MGTNARTALFAGSFDPFTIGHYDVVMRGLCLFDKIIVAIGCNDQKVAMFPAEVRMQQIGNFFVHEPRIEVTSYTGLTADFAREVRAQVLLRGIRSATDYEYERNLADTNFHLTGIDTFLLFTSQKLSHISSRSIRELIRHGHDVTDMLPPGFELYSSLKKC